jgi:hypothetical protein
LGSSCAVQLPSSGEKVLIDAFLRVDDELMKDTKVMLLLMVS